LPDTDTDLRFFMVNRNDEQKRKKILERYAVLLR